MGKIFYIMGKSASGKDRIYSLLVENKELNLKKLILYTTRPIRAGEEKVYSIILQMTAGFRRLRQPES